MEHNTDPVRVSRRGLLAGTGVTAASVWSAGRHSAITKGKGSRSGENPIAARVGTTPFVDTHEHLVEEEDRVAQRKSLLVPCSDWGILFSHYVASDLLVSGMPQSDLDRVLSPETDPAEKWPLLEPHWPAIRNTGYGQAIRIAASILYGIDEISAKTIPSLSEAFRNLIKPGYYQMILRDLAGIESCQVNSLERTFMESRQPALLMQDISILNFSLHGEGVQKVAAPAGITVRDLADYHRVIDWWFKTYGPYAVAAKSQVAYSRRLDFEDVPAEEAAPLFQRFVNGDALDENQRKKIDDHVFWYCVRKATDFNLPVKLHTGYYAGQNGMPLGRVMMNPADVCEILKRAPETTFVLMHIGYPYQEQMIAIAKHYTNAVVDMCWAWIVNPAASVRFLADFLVAAPSNKVLTFGGDYVLVEPVVGHAVMARHGISQALKKLVESGWLSREDALDLVEPIMCGNARRIFDTKTKSKRLEQAPWLA